MPPKLTRFLKRNHVSYQNKEAYPARPEHVEGFVLPVASLVETNC